MNNNERDNVGAKGAGWSEGDYDFEPPKKPVCKLSNTDGNVFSIIGRVSSTLRKAGQPEAAKEFAAKAMSSESYDAVLQLCFKYVDVR